MGRESRVSMEGRCDGGAVQVQESEGKRGSSILLIINVGRDPHNLPHPGLCERYFLHTSFGKASLPAWSLSLSRKSVEKMISSVFPASDTLSSVCIIPSLRRNFWTHAGLYPSPDGFNEVLLQPTSSPFRRQRFETGRTRQDNQVPLLRQILLRRPCRGDMQDRSYVYGMRVYLAEPRKLYTAQMPLLQVHRMERQPEAGGLLCEVRP